MKLRGGKWSKGDLIALLACVAAVLAIPGMPKVFHWDRESSPATSRESENQRTLPTGSPSSAKQVAGAGSTSAEARKQNEVRPMTAQSDSQPAIKRESQVPSGRNSEPSAPGPETQGARQQTMEVVADGVRFRLEKCERHSIDAVVCSITVEAMSKDMQIQLGQGQTFIVDSNGIKQSPQTKSLGASIGAASTLVVQNVPVRGEITFGGVNANVNRIALFQLEYCISIYGVGCHVAIFRNVQLQGQ